jgi:transketolase
MRRSLANEGISCRVLNMSTLQPLDEDAIAAAARDRRDRDGGGARGPASGWRRSSPGPRGEAATPMGSVGMKDHCRVRQVDELLEKYGLTAEGIMKEVKAVLARKAPGPDGHR